MRDQHVVFTPNNKARLQQGAISKNPHLGPTTKE